MSLIVVQSDYFWIDLQRLVDWYRDQAGSERATHFVDVVESTLSQLAGFPELGPRRFLDWPELCGIRSWHVKKPYHRHLIFYRFDEKRLFAERILHGARDLPRRLLESPYETDD